MFAKTCPHWTSKSPDPTHFPSLSVATWPAINRNSDALTRVICEYWPSGFPKDGGLWMVISAMWHLVGMRGMMDRLRPANPRRLDGHAMALSSRGAAAVAPRSIGQG
jgi:hypothetical protein